MPAIVPLIAAVIGAVSSENNASDAAKQQQQQALAARQQQQQETSLQNQQLRQREAGTVQAQTGGDLNNPQFQAMINALAGLPANSSGIPPSLSTGALGPGLTQTDSGSGSSDQGGSLAPAISSLFGGNQQQAMSITQPYPMEG